MLEPVGRPSSTKSAGAMRLQGAHACDPRAHDRRRCKSLKARLAGRCDRFSTAPSCSAPAHLGRRLAAAGTAPYPPDVRRRLKILNVICYLIATTTLLYAIQQATTDFATYAPMVYINLALVAAVLLVPFAHRINEIAGGVLLVVVEYAALVGFADLLQPRGRRAPAVLHRRSGAVRHLRPEAPLADRRCRPRWPRSCICMFGSRFPPTGQRCSARTGGYRFSLYPGRDHDRRADRGVGLLRVQPGRAGEGRDGRGAAQRSARRHRRAPQGQPRRADRRQHRRRVRDVRRHLRLRRPDAAPRRQRHGRHAQPHRVRVRCAGRAAWRREDQDHRRRLHGRRRLARAGARSHGAAGPHGARHARFRGADARGERAQSSTCASAWHRDL